MNLDLETRLSRAAQVLDEHIERPATAPGYVAPVPRPSRRRPLLVSVGVFGCVMLAAAVMLARGNDDQQRTITPGQAGPAGSEGWTTLPDAPISKRAQGLVVSTGDGVFVWGGYDDNNKSDGAYLDMTTSVWRKLPSAPLAGNRGDAVGVWTGREVVVLNGINDVHAAAFDPVAFTWRELPAPPLANAANAMNRAFFLDGAVIVIGVASESEGNAPSQVARLDLATTQWSIAANPPLQVGSFFQAAAAGDEIVIVGLRPNMKDECGSIILAYRPSTNTWREIAGGPAAERLSPVVVWTGSELFVGGGRLCSQLIDSSASADLLDLATGQWRHAPDAPIGFETSLRYADLWTGRSVATINRDGTPLLFNPATNQWHAGIPSANGGLSSESTPLAWAGGSIVVWSGDRGDSKGCCNPITGGEAYTPPPGF
ncbi:MAG: hypothetical protein ABI658_20765 [Acidimicrobiales bacterium]